MTDDKKNPAKPTPASTTNDESSVDIIAKDNQAAARGRVGVLSLIIAGFFGLLYAYFVWIAIGNLVALPDLYAAADHADEVPWVLPIIGLLVPIACYVIAFWVGLRSRFVNKVVVYIMGLAAVATLSYTVIAIHASIFTVIVTGP